VTSHCPANSRLVGSYKAREAASLQNHQHPLTSPFCYTKITMSTNNFKPALIIVDLQEDFCPPVRFTSLSAFTANHQKERLPSSQQWPRHNPHRAQTPRPPLRHQDRDQGLASQGPHLLRLQPRKQETLCRLYNHRQSVQCVRDLRDEIMARSLRARHQRRGADSRARHEQD